MMRRIQLYIDEALDDVVASEARRTGVSKAALIRAAVASRYRALPTVRADPLTALLGVSDDDPVDDINAVVYGA